MHLVGLYTYCKMMHSAYNIKSNTTAKRIRIYQMLCTAYKKIAAEDGLISPKHLERILKNKV